MKLQYSDPDRSGATLQPRRAIIMDVEFVADSASELPSVEVENKAKADKLLKVPGVTEVPEETPADETPAS